MINKVKIDEALEYYNINQKYNGKCYQALNIINTNEKFIEAYKKVYRILFEEQFDNLKSLWSIEILDMLFCDNIEPFITNLLILSGYELHKRNMKKYHFDSTQIMIHKKRVKECFENDLKNRNYNGVRISQMLWATYFIKIKIIEVGSLQFEYENTPNIKIHIPKNADISIEKVKESIELSKIEIKKVYNVDSGNYICNSWILSPELHKIIDKNTNISKFYNLFNVTKGENCLQDILDFVFNVKHCNSFFELEEKTSLQKLIKKELINNNEFYLGQGIFRK